MVAKTKLTIAPKSQNVSQVILDTPIPVEPMAEADASALSPKRLIELSQSRVARSNDA